MDSKQPRHSFARELFRFNNSSSSPSPSSSQNAPIQRIGSADGGPASPYGVIQHRSGNRAAVPMRKAKTHSSTFSSDSTTLPKDGADKGNSDKRANRLSAVLSPRLWSSGRSARSESKSHSKSASTDRAAAVAVSPPPTSTAHSHSPPTPPTSEARDSRVQHVVVMNDSAVIELPVGTRIGKLARANFKQHVQPDRHPNPPSTLPQGKARHASMPASFLASPDTPPSPSHQQQQQAVPLPLPAGQKARTMLVGISPPPTAALDGSLATFQHLLKHVLRENEEAILHTVLPESHARRQVTSPQDLIELTAELEREDEQFLEMQSACMNFLTLLAVELETTQRFVKIHVTQAQPPDGGTAAQARAHSRSHSRSHSRTRSRASSGAGAGHIRSPSLGGLLALGGGSGGAESDRGRSRVCATLKAREDEAIANELVRVARENNADLIVIGQPALLHEEAEGDPHRVQPHSRPQSRPHSRAASRAPSISGLRQVAEAGGDASFDPSRRGSRASKGSGGGDNGRRGSAIGEGSILLTRSDSKPSLRHLAIGQAPSALPADFSRSHSGYSSFSGSGSEGNPAFSPPPASTLSSNWNFGVAVLPTAPSTSVPSLNGADGAGHDMAQSPRTPSGALLHEDEGVSPEQEHLRDDDAHTVSTRVAQGLHLNAAHQQRSSSVAEDDSLTALPHSGHTQHLPEVGSSGVGGGSVQVARRGSHITIRDEPADSPLRERERERARQQQARAKGTMDSSSLSTFLEGFNSGGPGTSSDPNTGLSHPPPAGQEGESSVDSADLGSTATSRLRTRSASGSGNNISSAAKRLSKLLGKAHIFSSSSSASGSRQALNGLATELVKRSPVPVLVVNEDVLEVYK